MIGRGVAYRKTEEMDLCWRATVEMGVLFIERGVVYRKTRLHGILFISTVNLLQPPRATVHPPLISSSLHLRLFIHGLLFIQPPPLLHRLLFNQPSPRGPIQPPLHGLLFIQPSTSYCSTSPPRAPIHPALHGVLFIHPQPARSIGVLFIQWQRPLLPRGPVHPPPSGTVHPTPPTKLTVHQEAAGSIGFS